jgi:hypothetical protein
VAKKSTKPQTRNHAQVMVTMPPPDIELLDLIADDDSLKSGEAPNKSRTVRNLVRAEANRRKLGTPKQGEPR